MIGKKVTKRTLLAGPLLAALLGAGTLAGCGSIGGLIDGQGSGTVSERSGESGGEHRGGEGSEGSGGEGTGRGEVAAANQLKPDETFDMVRSGARLILGYDAASNAFKGTVENTTNNVLQQVRIEVHLSNGAELGPTIPIDLGPGEKVDVILPATAAAFTSWVAHAEVGSGGEGSGGEGSGGESGPDGPEGKETSAEAAMEAAMSSPVTPLDRTWDGNFGGLAISARYDAATRTIHYTVRNTTQQVLCYVQSEPHLKSGTQTVGELGPDVLGHLSPSQQVTSSIAVASEPKLAGVAFDGYVIHMEVFDCGGTGPTPHTGGEGGEGSGGEGHGSGGEGSGSEGGVEGSGGGEEATANQLKPDETFDMVRAGARLILSYDASSNAFKGTVENTTNNVLRQVRIEVHLSNGAELGPTTPVDLAPGEKLAINLPATAAAFTSWVAHAEVGSGGEGGGEHGGSGGGEGSGEHGSGGEQSGGG